MRTASRETLNCAGADVDNDDDTTVLCNEEDALMNRGTVCSDSSCDTELSAKETPRSSEAFSPYGLRGLVVAPLLHRCCTAACIFGLVVCACLVASLGPW